jgi:hypothetical protein
MPEKVSIRISEEMEEYIRQRTTDLRIATTCEGPLIFSVKISPPKPTDLFIEVSEHRIYISAVQAPLLKVIDTSIIPRCAIGKGRE